LPIRHTRYMGMREGELNPELCLSQVHPNQVQASRAAMAQLACRDLCVRWRQRAYFHNMKFQWVEALRDQRHSAGCERRQRHRRLKRVPSSAMFASSGAFAIKRQAKYPHRLCSAD
jgi:uncharacterized protein (DUF924 family)